MPSRDLQCRRGRQPETVLPRAACHAALLTLNAFSIASQQVTGISIPKGP
jgi:hypothetical protein